MDIRPLEISDEDPLEVRLVTDVVVRKEFKPCPNMFPHANGKILNDEMVPLLWPDRRVGSLRAKCLGLSPRCIW